MVRGAIAVDVAGFARRTCRSALPAAVDVALVAVLGVVAAARREADMEHRFAKFVLTVGVRCAAGLVGALVITVLAAVDAPFRLVLDAVDAALHALA